MVGRTIDNLFPKLPAKIGAPVLEVRDLVHQPLTRGVSFTLRAGEIVGLAGLCGEVAVVGLATPTIENINDFDF